MVQNGIQLHRAIDAFTDNHNATWKWKNISGLYYRLRRSVLCDVVLTHFLQTIAWVESVMHCSSFINWYIQHLITAVHGQAERL